ncbi:MAG: CocE/NonD family hydrolase [Armatimonadetes bacterium]|nr:CocE/NonD family hydrolase [Armatimonadota bacterium]
MDPTNGSGSPPRRAPRYEEVLIRPDVRVAMRDRVALVTDLYLPAAGGRAVEDPMPALLMRTPYDKGPSNRADAMRLARHGYLVAVQDVRGRYASDGVFQVNVQEAEDGYDTIEWLAAQPPCDGRVGMLGTSYLAYSQGSAATQSPPHLAAMCQTFGYPHGYHNVRQGGALDVFWLSYIVGMAGDGKEARADPSVREALLQMRFEEWLRRYPLREGQSPLALAPSYERTFFDYLRRECLDEFWRRPGLSPAEYLDRWPDIPTLWICGWFDHYPYCHPDTLAFTRLTRLGHRNQHVVFGPWTHGETGRKIGQVTFGEACTREARFPDYELRWFDRWFKGVDDDGVFAAPVQYFVMGGGPGTLAGDGLLEHGGEWRTGPAWPPANVTMTAWHLHPGGGLATAAPEAGPAATTFRADPDDPAPSSTGVCYTATRLVGGGSRRINPNGLWDQVEGPHLHGVQPPYLPLEARSDVLVFQTGPLARDLEMAGHPVVELCISSDAPDTDFVAKLIDVYPPSPASPGGIALGLSEGIRRAKFRNGCERPELLTPGEVYRVRIELRPLAARLKAGHRLRVDITSSSWPHFDVNTHTGRNPSEDHERRVAHNTVYHAKEHPSRLLLPVARADGG